MESDLTALHTALLSAWNRQDARDMANLFAPSGSQIGLDGSTANGPDEIHTQFASIFRDRPTGHFVAKILEVRVLEDGVGLLRAVAGMVPPGATEIRPEINAIQTLVARRVGMTWKIELFQNTPAGCHGQADDAAKLTGELQALV